MDKHVFISYKRDEGDFAEVLINRVEKADFKTWVDNDKLHAGEDWRTEIDQAINSAFALIVIMTPEAKASEYVTYEWAFAWGSGIKVIPLVLKHTSLHPRLEALQYLDFTNRTARPWDKLIDVLKNAADAQANSTNTKMNVTSTDNTYSIHIPQDAPTFIKQAIVVLDSTNADDRIAAVDSLAQSNHMVAREALIATLQHPIQDVRIYASLRLAQFDDKRAVPGLLEALYNEESWELRKSFAEALGKIGDATAIPDLLKALRDDEDESVRKSVAEALGKIGDAAAIPDLLKALRDDEDESVRKSVAEALGKIGDATVVPDLLIALHKENWNVRKSIAGALGSLGDATAAPDLLKTLRKAGGEIRKSIVEALIKIGKPSVPSLLEALHNEKSWEVRRSVAEALGKIGDATAIPDLLKALRDDEDKDVRKNAAEALGKIGDINAVPGLLEALHCENWNIRESVAEALGKIGDATAIPDLITTLQNEKEPIYVRVSALEALGKMENMSSLLDALHDKDEDVRNAAVKVLRQIGIPEALATINAQKQIETN